MGGVGKTALLTHINNELVKNFPGYTSVSWVTVSQKFTIHKLQDDIASAMQFSLYEDDVKKRAAELSDFLRRRKNYVLILDDVWEDINLDEVGICLCVNGCKLILTTRSFDVCRKMDCQKKIKVVPLCEEESWELFRHKLGDDMELTSEIQEVAKSLVKECAGLPLGIITMARSMKGIDDMFEWKNALENMRESKLEHDDMEMKVYQVLKYSYDMLKDSKVQQCFLDCSLYPEDYAIEREVLIDQFIDERLIDGMKSRQAEIYRGQTILNKLINACLLENFEIRGRWYVKMHDLVRDMALQISSTSPRVLVEAGVELKDMPDKEEWVEDLVKVSLMDNNLSNITITTPPSLVNLTALLLKRCQRLKSLPSLGNLQALRRLDLSHSGITELPQGMEVLLNLRYLHLFTSSLQILPGILENLIRLQFLVLDWHTSDKMGVKGEELTHLRRLETLKVQLHDVNDLNTYVKSLEERKLVSYVLQVGFDRNSFWKESEYAKIVVIKKSDTSKSTSEEYPLLLPQGIQFLCIESCRLVRSLSEAASLGNISNLRACHVVDCDGMENLLSIPSFCSTPFLQNLEELKLQRLQDFRGLIDEERGVASLPPPGTFSSLKDIQIIGCPSIKKLFTPALILLFQNLERMKVSCCDHLVEIIGATSDENGEGSCSMTTQINLPKLMRLELIFLQELRSICNRQETLVADSLQEIRIEDCSSLKKLSLLDDEMCQFPSLQKISVRKDWWESLEWEQSGAKNVLQPLCHFQKWG